MNFDQLVYAIVSLVLYRAEKKRWSGAFDKPGDYFFSVLLPLL